jgi:NAD+ synthase (glutamine-hydrolysing)
MKLIKLAAAALNQTPLDWARNRSNIVAAIRAAREQQAHILCLPELCVSGYGCEDVFLSAALHNQSLKVLHSLLAETRGLIVAVGLPLLYQNRVYNTACLLVDGDIAGFVAKRFLAGDGIHYEPRWFHPWPAGLRAEIELDRGIGEWPKAGYPIGDLDFDCGGVQIGFEICEEAWVAQRPGIQLAQRGVDIILNPSASHFAFGKHTVRRRFVLEGARAFSACYVYSNLLGNEAGRVIYDGDCLIAAGGKLLAENPRFSFADWQVISALVDVDLTRMSQARTSPFVPNPESYVRVSFEFREAAPSPPSPKALGEGNLKYEEFACAEALGLFDYLRKSRSHGFVLSLSGGADSSAIACLARIMVELGVAELGFAGFTGKLGYRSFTAQDIPGLMRELLTCVYQATVNSSDTTRHAARTLAEALGAEFLCLDIEPLARAYVTTIEQAIGRELTWAQDDLALQNIQARARSPGVWLLANLRHALLLATSNRSEAGVGYATMDGDTSGGLSPLAGIDKDFIRAWLRWLESEGLAGLPPIPALHWVNAQQPTAELRPGQGQTDEADLMPYDLLDAVEQAAIRDRQTPWEIFCRLSAEFPHYGRENLLIWIERFFRLWSRNQWKRERFAPGFHLDDYNLDPRSACRFPILSGGFGAELSEMRALSEQSED